MCKRFDGSEDDDVHMQLYTLLNNKMVMVLCLVFKFRDDNVHDNHERTVNKYQHRNIGFGYDTQKVTFSMTLVYWDLVFYFFSIFMIINQHLNKIVSRIRI